MGASFLGRGLLTLALCPAAAHAAEAETKRLAPSFGGELALGVIGSGGDFGRSIRGGLTAGLSMGTFGLGTFGTVTTFRSQEVPNDTEEWLVTFETGLEGQVTFLDGIARSAVRFGPSFLLRGATVDASSNDVGLHFDLRPLGVRFRPARSAFRFTLDPLSVAFIASRLSAAPLVDVQFNTALALEVLP